MLIRLDRLILGAAMVAICALATARAHAARDFAPPAPGELEFVVMEVEGCKYCPLFRDDVTKGYARSPRARDVPIRFVNINAEGTDRLRLQAPIATVPTTVLMRKHVEVGRIEGYVAPDDFARLVARLLSN